MYYYWGMHAYWWVFWFLLWILFLSFMVPVRRITYRQMQSPLQTPAKEICRGGDHKRGVRRTAYQTPARCQCENMK